MRKVIPRGTMIPASATVEVVCTVAFRVPVSDVLEDGETEIAFDKFESYLREHVHGGSLDAYNMRREYDEVPLDNTVYLNVDGEDVPFESQATQGMRAGGYATDVEYVTPDFAEVAL